jgi:probable phosphoglycerate mutase
MTRRFVVEADGGSRGNPGPAAYGALVRDAGTGEVLVELAEHLGVATNNVAEYSGLVAGLTAARELDPAAEVEVRMDSKLVVEQMSGRWKIKHEGMRRLALLARDAFPASQVAYTWVPRARNKAADGLVNASLDAVARGEDGRIDRRARDVGDSAGGSEGDGAGDPPADVATADATTPVPVTAADTAAPPRPAVVGWGPDIGDPMVLTVVRHGVTAATSDRRFSGRGGEDHPLSDTGFEQARRAAREVLARGGADVLVSSPLLRTRQTAEVVAEVTGLVPVVVDGLQECGFGDWDGLTFADVMQRWPDLLERWLGDPDVAPPGGESSHQLYERVGAALAQLRETYAGARVIAVGHVGTVRALTARALQTPLLSMNRMELQPASITTLTWYRDGNASLRGYGEATHLRDLTGTSDRGPWSA